MPRVIRSSNNIVFWPDLVDHIWSYRLSMIDKFDTRDEWRYSDFRCSSAISNGYSLWYTQNL